MASIALACAEQGPRLSEHLQNQACVLSTLTVGRAPRKRNRDKRRNGKVRFVEHLSDGFKEIDDKAVYFAKLPPDVDSKEEVADTFQDNFGIVTHIHIQPDKKFGFIHFESEECANKALAAESLEIRGVAVKIKKATRGSAGHHPGDGEEHAQLDGSGSEVNEDVDGDDDGVDALGDVDGDPQAEAERGNDVVDDDGLGKFWDERPNDDKRSGEKEGDEQAEEHVQALRVACIHALESSLNDGEMLHELGSDPLILEHKTKLPAGMHFIDFIRTFPENFTADDQGNGRFLISLVSPDADDVDVEKVGALLDKAANTLTRRERRKQTREARAAENVKTRDRERPNLRSQPPPKASKSVVAGVLSDGWKQRDDRTVWVGNLPRTLRTKEDLGRAFEAQIGPVTHVHINEDLSFGFVHFAHEHHALAAANHRSVNVLGTNVEIKNGTRFGDSGNRSRALGQSADGYAGRHEQAPPPRHHWPAAPYPPPPQYQAPLPPPPRRFDDAHARRFDAPLPGRRPQFPPVTRGSTAPRSSERTVASRPSREARSSLPPKPSMAPHLERAQGGRDGPKRRRML